LAQKYAVIIVVGMISVLSLVTVRQDLEAATSTDAAALVPIGTVLATIHEWASLFGSAYCAGLVPRGMALLGLIGGPLTCAAATAVLFGFFERSSGPELIATLPEIAWEAALGIYLIVKGFTPSPILLPPARSRSVGGRRMGEEAPMPRELLGTPNRQCQMLPPLPLCLAERGGGPGYTADWRRERTCRAACDKGVVTRTMLPRAWRHWCVPLVRSTLRRRIVVRRPSPSRRG
jgi:hypothetical protein